MHAALAAVISEGDERRVWHRAAAANGPDDRLAAELTAAAVRCRRRGTPASAVTGLERAAQLSVDPAEQVARLLSATTTAYEWGDHETVRRLMRMLAERELPPAAAARLAWMHEAMLGSGWSGADRLAAYIEVLDRMRLDGEPDLALSELSSTALRFFWSNPDEETRDRMLAAADRFGVSPDEPRLIAVRAMAAPLGAGAAVLKAIDRLSRRLGGTPEELGLLALAASALGDFPRSLTLATAAVDALRLQRQLGLLTQALVSQATVAAQLGDVRLAQRAADEARSLAAETGQPRWALTAGLALGHAAALRGDGATARRLADAAESTLLPLGAHPMLALVQLIRGVDALAESTLLPLGAHPMLALVQLIRGVDALAEGRHAAAFDHLRPIFDPVEVPYHPVVRCWALTHLADAAVGSGREAELRPLVAALPDVDLPVLRVARTYTAALLDPGDEAFGAVLDPEWPFERARLQHAYGVWLRRRRRVSESRDHLRSATAALNALGVRPWAERARAELRAAGESSPRGDDARDRLTPQELQIALLAADGLTNRDIGERLFLSPRTISTHLYRIFPKLGVASRTELVRALMT